MASSSKCADLKPGALSTNSAITLPLLNYNFFFFFVCFHSDGWGAPTAAVEPVSDLSHVRLICMGFGILPDAKSLTGEG